MSAPEVPPAVVRRIGAERRAEFLDRGLRSKRFFAHEVLHLPKPGPDGWVMAERMCPARKRRRLWELVLYATPELVRELPRELFFDREVVWHEQHFGRAGQVATANLVAQGRSLYAMNCLSDLVQRVSRRPELRSRVENRFKGWPDMLWNAVLDFALARGFRTVHGPTAAFALRHTDPERDVGRELFDRVYDRALLRSFEARQDGDWWRIEVRKNRGRCVRGERVESPPSRSEPVVCILHDIELGLGHGDLQPDFVDRAETVGRDALPRMLRHEADAGVRATYSVVGCLLDGIRSEIEAGGHALAFHSFDHRLEEPRQLLRCRQVDYRLKGYRPPRSELSDEVREGGLLQRGFEWVASAESRWQRSGPVLGSDGVVRIPVHLDDFSLHTGALDWPDWERRLLDRVGARPLTVVGLHDCYADHWLPRYETLLGRLGERAVFRTLDDVSTATILRAAC